MDLFLVRHAIAEAPSPETEDAGRGLTPGGRKKFREAVTGFKQWMKPCDRLYHSPLLRAVETAEMLVPLVKGETEVSPLLAAAPGDELLATLTGVRVFCVGHEPWLSQLAALLLTGNLDHATSFTMKKGGLVWLRGEPRASGMTLQAFIPPRVSRR